MDDYIIGNVRRIIYKNTNGYIVGVFKVSSGTGNFESLNNLTLSFTGYFHELSEDENYKFFGNIVNHPKYGEQFNVTFYERVMPEEKDSIVEFLSSGTFKGIGKKTAEKVVDVLGSNALQMIIDNPSNLMLIPGLSKKQIETLQITLQEYSNSYNTILKLNDMGFLSRESLDIYNKYKANTLNVIEENLYMLVQDIKNITFKKVDAIALKNNYLREDKRRVVAAILCTMEELCNTLSHCYLHIDHIYKYTIITLGNNISEELFIEALNSLILDLKVIKLEEKYYLRSMWDAEETIVNRISFLTSRKDIRIDKLDDIICEIEEDKHIKYNDEQKNAIISSLKKNFLIITGGPGTGKTTIVSTIIELYRRVYNLSYDNLVNEMVLLAPTGRASKRLTEKSLFPASTIHSFLKWNKESDRFAINEFNKSDAKIVIIDEASMIDVVLFSSLLKGLRSETRIIMVGDYDQLPSVGPGQLLKDLIESDMLPVVSLKELYRQGEDSSIISLAHDVNSGVVNEGLFNVNEDLEFISATNVMDPLSKIAEKYKKVSYMDFQVLVPMYKGVNGIDNINKNLQAIFNPPAYNKKEIEVGDVIYREKDKILQLVNMPDERIYNGDIGVIKRIDNKDIIIVFDTSEVRFTPSNFNKFKHGYAISIHKSQGSEFDTVVVPVFKTYNKMLYRKLYYTAITRTKKKLIMIGDISSLKLASTNNNQDIRMTTIKDKIIKKLSI